MPGIQIKWSSVRQWLYLIVLACLLNFACAGKHGDSSGILFGCVDSVTGAAFLLFGFGGHCWQMFYGLADRADRRNRQLTACREGGEESCSACGSMKEIYNKYFKTGLAKYLCGGIFFVNLGRMSEGARSKIIANFDKNRYGGGLGRPIKRCEKEMSKIRWVGGETVLKHSDCGLGPFRRDMAQKLRAMRHMSFFVNWCKGGHSSDSTPKPIADGHDHGPVPVQPELSPITQRLADKLASQFQADADFVRDVLLGLLDQHPHCAPEQLEKQASVILSQSQPGLVESLTDKLANQFQAEPEFIEDALMGILDQSPHCTPEKLEEQVVVLLSDQQPQSGAQSQSSLIKALAAKLANQFPTTPDVIEDMLSELFRQSPHSAPEAVMQEIEEQAVVVLSEAASPDYIDL